MEKHVNVSVDERTYLGIIRTGSNIEPEVRAHWIGTILCDPTYVEGYGEDNNWYYIDFAPSKERVLKNVELYSKLCDLNDEKEIKKFKKLALKKYSQRDAIKKYVKEKMALGRKQRQTLLPPSPHEQRFLITSIDLKTQNIYDSEIKIEKTDIPITHWGRPEDDDEFVRAAKNLYVSKNLLLKKFEEHKSELVFDFLSNAPEDDFDKQKIVASATMNVLKYQNLYSEVYIKDPINYPNAISETWYFPNGIPKELPTGELFFPMPREFRKFLVPFDAHWIWANEDNRETFFDEFHDTFSAFK
jgi:hypothetical protein